jgi:hypothetical protein
MELPATVIIGPLWSFANAIVLVVLLLTKLASGSALSCWSV